MDDRILIVGAGLGGLSAAIYLASAGRRVTVFEKNELVGGKSNELRVGGFRWDTGPTVITLRSNLADLFAAAGRRIEDYLALVPVDPLTRYFYHDGTILDIRPSLSDTVASIRALEPRDAAGYLRFLAYAAEMYDITAPVVLQDDPPTLRSILRMPLIDMLRVDFGHTMDRAICSRVRSVYLRHILRRFATYLGASPYRARAYLNVIAHVELTAGLWYPMGGTYEIARAYRRLAQELDVEIRTATLVKRIAVKGSRAIGVELADGTTERGSAVVANVDATMVYCQLLPELGQSKTLKRWLDRPYSCSGFVMFLGVSKTHPKLRHHNILFSPDYEAEFDAIFSRGVPFAQPTIYVAITSKTDPGHAPEGAENWYVMTNVPPTGETWDWDREAQGYRDLVLSRLADLGFDVREAIACEQVLTPIEIERRTGAWRGALYGHSFNSPLASFQRPHNRCPDLRGLYFVGGTTHPGGGVPMVTLSGKTVARMILSGGGE